MGDKFPFDGEVIAVYRPKQRGYITVKPKDKVKVTKQSDDGEDFWAIVSEKKEGWIPKYYIKNPNAPSRTTTAGKGRPSPQARRPRSGSPRGRRGSPGARGGSGLRGRPRATGSGTPVAKITQAKKSDPAVDAAAKEAKDVAEKAKQEVKDLKQKTEDDAKKQEDLQKATDDAQNAVAEAKRQVEEMKQQAAAEKKKKEEDDAAKKKQDEDAAAAKKKQEEEAAAKKKEADAAAAKKKQEEEAAKKKQEAEDAKKKQDEEAAKKEADAAAAKKKQDEEAAAKKKEADAAAKKKQDEDAAARKKEADDAAAKKKQDEDAAAKKKEADDAAAKKKQEAEAAARKKEADDAAAKKKEADAAAAKKAEPKSSVPAAGASKLLTLKEEKDERARRLKNLEAARTNTHGKLMPRAAIAKIKENETGFTYCDLSENTIYQMQSLEYTNSIARALTTNSSLIILRLVKCGISDSSASKLGMALGKNQTLLELDLSQNKIGSDGVMALAVGLSKNRSLQTLNLNSQGKRFGEAALACIVKMFDTNITLTNIIWRLDSKQAWAITKRISRNKEIERRIREERPYDDIDPRKSQADQEGNPNSAFFAKTTRDMDGSGKNRRKALDDSVATRKKVRPLPSVSGNISRTPSKPKSKPSTLTNSSGKVPDSARKAPARKVPSATDSPSGGFIRRRPKSSYTDVKSTKTSGAKKPTATDKSEKESFEAKKRRSRSAVYSKSAATKNRMMPRKAIQMLKDNEASLKSLDLSNNTLYQMKNMEYTKMLGEALAKNTTCVEIHLKGCGISDSGAQRLAMALKTNSTLIELDLEKNKIGSNGVMALAIGLSKNTTLKTLNLNSQGKRFGEAALACIVKMFDTNITLTNIIWRLDSKQAWAITKRISRNKEIERRIREGRPYDDIDPRKS